MSFISELEQDAEDGTRTNNDCRITRVKVRFAAAHALQKECMMIVMRNSKHKVRTAAKEASHERIVSAAARAIRRSGYDGTGVADIMKEAGLTHGAFYAHFPSREAMLAEAASRACAEAAAGAADLVAKVPSDQTLASMLRAYLSPEHLAQIELGCPLAALGSETPRQTPEVRRVTTRHIKETIDLIARQLPDWGQPGAHERALVTLATMVGALVLARTVDEPALSTSLREAALKHLVPA
jgi:TetR/AcrR family transcriptional regulator, transcriptional repressor for nem operon